MRRRSGTSPTRWRWRSSSAACRCSYAGEDLAGAVAAFVREYGITHIVLGRTQRPWYRRWFGQSPLDRLLRAVRGVDVVIVDTV